MALCRSAERGTWIPLLVPARMMGFAVAAPGGKKRDDKHAE
jgi:hypothetical protein